MENEPDLLWVKNAPELHDLRPASDDITMGKKRRKKRGKKKRLCQTVHRNRGIGGIPDGRRGSPGV